MRRAVVLLLVAGLTLAGCSWRTQPLTGALRPPGETTRIFAADGSLLVALHAEEDRDVVPFERMPKVLVDAVVDIEDSRFWQHSGVDIRAVVRALRRNSQAGEVVEGGSTITQQYVKNTYTGTKRTTARKIAEARAAWDLERHATKQRILELYLNSVYFGNGAYGVSAASRVYFGVAVDQLTLAQAALLAGIIHAPNATDPFAHPDEALARRNLVLNRMAALGSVPGPDTEAAAASPLELRERASEERYPAPYFVEEVKQFILDDPRFGETPEARRDLLFSGGLRIATTLDPARQAAAEQAVASVLTDPSRMPAGALVSIEPRTGFVRALVGGRDFFGRGAQAKFDLAGQGHRQAGSAFKPFVLAAALEAGIPLAKTYPAPSHIDIPLPAGSVPPVWSVDNAENEAGGTLDLTEATVHSVNTVFAQLVMEVGPAQAVAMAARLGIRSPLLPYPSAVLGTNDVTPLEMASAYGTLANGGIRVAPALVTRVTRADGTVLFDHTHEQQRVLDPAIAATETAVLEQVVTRGTGRAAALDRPAAGKTGTAEEWRDAWFVGYTPELATAVWVGFPEAQRSMRPPATPIAVFGGTWPAQIWHSFMATALRGVPVTPFPGAAPDGPVTTTTTTAPPPVPVLAPVPQVVGMAADDATAALAAAGFVAVRDSQPDEKVPAGQVMRERPAGGAQLAVGTPVTIVVSSGSASVVVPDVLGRQEAEARSSLETAGLQPDVVVAAQPGGGGRPGQVWRQDPTPASRQPRGAAVTITVNPG